MTRIKVNDFVKIIGTHRAGEIGLVREVSRLAGCPTLYLVGVGIGVWYERKEIALYFRAELEC